MRPSRFVVVLLVLVAATGAHRPIALAWRAAFGRIPAGSGQTIWAEVIWILPALLLVTRWRWWGRVGITRSVRFGSARYLWLPAIYLLLSMLAAYHTSGAGDIAALAAADLLVGLNEELWVRGLMLETLRGKGATYAAVLTGLLFGVEHLLNLTSQPFGATITQVGYAALIGMGLAGLRITQESLWPVIAWHVLFDFISDLQSGPHPAVQHVTWASGTVVVMLFVPLGAYGLWLARHRAAPSPEEAHWDTRRPIRYD